MPDPIQESHRGRDDVLDEFRLPSGEFDSEFRMPWLGRRRDCKSVMQQLAVLAAVALPAVLFVQYVLAGAARSGFALAAAYLTGILLAGWHAVRMVDRRPDPLDVVHLVTTRILGPLFLLVAVGLSTWTTTVTGSIVYFAAVAVPAVSIVSDNLSTHALYWMTANPRVDLPTMLSVREAWRYRFVWLFGPRPARENLEHLSCELEEVFRWYPLQPVVLSTMIIVPQFAWLWLARQESEMLGTVMVAGSLVSGLSAFAVFTWLRSSRSVRSWPTHFVHWLRYDPHALAPPWVFRSPVGQARSRLALSALGFLPLAAAVLGMTLWCSFIPVGAEQLLEAARTATDIQTVSWWQVLAAGLRGLACLTLAIGCYLLALYGLSQNVIGTLHQLFEE
jgi:hypothetical protein